MGSLVTTNDASPRGLFHLCSMVMLGDMDYLLLLVVTDAYAHLLASCFAYPPFLSLDFYFFTFIHLS